jgi:UDP-N-acetylmuramoylalanine--D-glutamate ligase
VRAVSSWTGKKVTVIGFAIEGEDMARYFQQHGAHVTVSTTRVAAAMQERRIELEGRGVRFRVGPNDPADVAGADLVCVTQGVPQGNPVVVAARDEGIPVQSMTSMFFDAYPGPICGITGSSGKTTTTSLVDAVFSAAGREHVLGGNIGLGLMSLLDNAVPERWAVLEVSHTQLVLTGRSPRVAAVTNVTPNHLDQFTWDEYVALKRRIFELQGRDDHVVFNLDDPVSRNFRHDARGRMFLFSIEGDHACDGAFVKDGAVFWRCDARTEKVIGVEEVPLRGRHNVANVAAATAVAAACEIGPEAVAAAVRGFKAPAHRLELVGSIEGVSYYNDSIATAPERTLAALRSFSQPIVLLLGGRDKNLPLIDMLEEAKQKCRAAVCFGESGPMLADAADRVGVAVTRAGDLPEAFRAARTLARAGDIVLLSPACTSFDAYENFEQRGEEFRRLVRQLETEGGDR